MFLTMPHYIEIRETIPPYDDFGQVNLPLRPRRGGAYLISVDEEPWSAANEVLRTVTRFHLEVPWAPVALHVHSSLVTEYLAHADRLASSRVAVLPNSPDMESMRSTLTDTASFPLRFMAWLGLFRPGLPEKAVAGMQGIVGTVYGKPAPNTPPYSTLRRHLTRNGLGTPVSVKGWIECAKRVLWLQQHPGFLGMVGLAAVGQAADGWSLGRDLLSPENQ